MKKYIDIPSFTGGEADNPYKGPANSFFQAENVQIRKYLDRVTLEAKLVDTGWNIPEAKSYMVSLNDLGINSSSIIVCTDNGKIYLDGVLKQTITGSFKKIIGIGSNADSNGTVYIYYFTNTSFGEGKIHRSTIDLNTWNQEFRTFEVESGAINKITVINNANTLYIGVKNTVFTFNRLEVLTPSFILPEGETIQFLSRFQNQYRVYSNIGTTRVNYIWDGFSVLSDYRQEYKNQPILAGVNNGGYDYLIIGFNEFYSRLIESTANQESLLRVNLEVSENARIFSGFISIRNGITYISGGKSGESQNYGIYTYGNYFPGTPQSLVQSYSLGSSAFTHHCHVDTESFFACNDGKIYKVSHNNPPSVYADSGYIVSLMYDFSSWDEVMTQWMKLAYKCNGGEVKIYVRTELGQSWQLLKTINNDKKKTTIYNSEFSSLDLGYFTEFQIKIELVKGATGSPYFKRPTLEFEVVNENT